MNEVAVSPQVTSRGLELAERLERHFQLPLDQPEHIERWDTACGELSDWIDTNFPEIPPDVLHHLEHYFTDSDIHAKEPGYRTDQENELRLFIRQLRGGPLPERKRAWWRFW